MGGMMMMMPGPAGSTMYAPAGGAIGPPGALPPAPYMVPPGYLPPQV